MLKLVFHKLGYRKGDEYEFNHDQLHELKDKGNHHNESTGTKLLDEGGLGRAYPHQ